MHYRLFTLRPHGDVTKFELEDGLIRTTATALLNEPSSITEIRVDVPRDIVDVGIDVPSADDPALITISAESVSDVMTDLAPLVDDFAMIVGVGQVDHLEIAPRERTWPGTATPGTAVRLRANAAPGINKAGLTGWVTDSLIEYSQRYPNVGIQALIAASDADAVSANPLSSVYVSFTFPAGEDPSELLTPRALAAVIESELLDPNSLFVNMVTEHRVIPKTQVWT